MCLKPAAKPKRKNREGNRSRVASYIGDDEHCKERVKDKGEDGSKFESG
jgi:hypothetical protein